MHARNVNTCYVRPIDCGPTRDFPRSVRVCIVVVSASHASKLRLVFSVSFIDASSPRTSPGCVARIHEPDWDTSARAFIDDKALQLVKRPTVQTVALLFTSPYPSTDALQILQGDTAFGALSSTNYLLRNYVVNISGEPLLLPPPATHETLGGFCAFLLKLASQANVASSATVDLRPGEACSVRRLSDATSPRSTPSQSRTLDSSWSGTSTVGKRNHSLSR
jgi:hypothetical protein